MIAGGNWWRANEIVIRHLTRRTATRYRCRDRAVPIGREPDADPDKLQSIAATSAAGAPVMAAIRRQMCSVGDKRSARTALTLSIVGWRSGSPPGVRQCFASPPLPILPPGTSAAPRVSMVSMRAFKKKAVDRMDRSETTGRRGRDRPSSRSLNAPVAALLRHPRRETPISPTRATTSIRFSS
jgi:hypothetical protein